MKENRNPICLPDNSDLKMIEHSNVDLIRWKEISANKTFFLDNVSALAAYDALEPDIAQSWIRSRKYGIEPDMQNLNKRIKSMELKALIKDNKQYIDIVHSNIKTFLTMLNIPNYTIGLNDENGVLLFHLEAKIKNPLHAEVGSIWTEETVGTCSLSLAVRTRQIVQLAGPRHYCRDFENHMSITVPISGPDNDSVKYISLIHSISNENIDYINYVKEHIVHWVLGLRSAIERQLVFLDKISTLETMNQTLQEKLYMKNTSFSPSADSAISDINSSITKDAVYVFSDVWGESPQIKKAIHTAINFANVNNGILIKGESGTGKELFAHAIHNISKPNCPFVAINCAAIPRNLIESELFGYVGGAFTGAERRGQKGKIEMADGGTLFLDEIGDMPMEIQPVFLRVLEDKKVMKLGSNKYTPIEFRLIAATNKDLYQLVLENKFREDLYYRLECLEIMLPPLREREDDILLLANRFIENICRDKKCSSIPVLSNEIETILLTYAWPGNIRQLKNAMTYAVNMCQGKTIKRQDLPGIFNKDPSDFKHKDQEELNSCLSIKQLERDAIKKALKISGNNVTPAAELLGLSKTTLYRKIKEYNLS